MHPATPPAPSPDVLPIRRVLVSVFDKTGLDRLAAALAAHGIEVVSTGGTATALAGRGVAVTDVSQVTGFPEMLDGRVKTLHPHVFAGVLARTDRPDDLAVLDKHGIARFDAVIVNLYAFEEAIRRPGCLPHEAIELIDIGGPSLIRAAAKNHAFTAVVTGPEQYDELVAAIAAGGTTRAQRKLLAARAFERTATYDAVISWWMAGHAGLVVEGAVTIPAACDATDEAPLPSRMSLELERRMPLRYGENPHQAAALFAPPGTHLGLAGLRQLAGKELSYNNLLDLDAATRLAGLIQDPGAVVIKHTNPCGAASAAGIAEALAAALAADPTSAFGSIVAVNRTFDLACAESLTAPGLFVEVVAAPAFEPAAVELLTTKPAWKASVRLVATPPGDPWEPTAGLELRGVAGGFLAQRPDEACDDPATWRVVTTSVPPAELTPALDFAFTVVRRLTSNAIAVCRGTSLVGAGTGQTSRVDAVRVALEKAGG
ncbi:MAG: bifunctional phosphoribosylaminoimidazolecarboxamide formyltransferase/IMP cyclohydrolase, partial [Planctomycetes bacterium]|nr:bifunctional phosphoribosylaminoimidazolecarboxamide formyltransferase/IMP cyclohydrolase [Planctomycetota bacterium]